MKTTLKLTQTDSDFLEKTATKLAVNEEEWFYMPYWLHKAADGIFVQYPFNDLPDHVMAFIKTERALNIQP